MRTLRLLSVAAGAAFMFAAGSASADGMYRGSIKDAPLYSWTGLYVGVNGGYSWGNADTALAVATSLRDQRFTLGGVPISDTTTPIATFFSGGDTDMNGWLGGVHAGYNWQAHRWVLGLEADIQRTSEDGSIFLCAVPGCAAGSPFGTASHKLDWFGTLRARVGVLLQPNLLVYGTGGLAYGHVSSDYTIGLLGVNSVALSDDKTKAGWVVGGGVEGMLGPNWTLRAEYLYMDLGDVGSVAGSTTLAAPPIIIQDRRVFLSLITDANLRTHFTDQIFRVGLSYKFGCCDAAPLK